MSEGGTKLGLLGGRTRAAITLFLLGVALALLAVAGCVEEDAAPLRAPGTAGAGQPPPAILDVAEAARRGEELFNANCSACHGVGAVGTSIGPPLTHRFYHPGHHPDFSIRDAVSRGVMQHHWFFGDMAPVPGLSADDVEKVICYVRQKQRAEGLFEGDDFKTVC